MSNLGNIRVRRFIKSYLRKRIGRKRERVKAHYITVFVNGEKK